MTTYHVTPAGREYAQRLTKQIKAAADNLWELLLEAWNSKAYVSLGYKSWSAYVDAEFDFNRAHSYRLVNQGQVIKQLREAAKVSPVGDNFDVRVSEREARDIAPVMPEVIEQVQEQVAAGVPAQEAVRVAVEAARTPPRPVVTRSESCVHEYVCRHCGEILQ